MDQHPHLADQFEADRPRLQALAHRFLGNATDADDAVQEAWIRLSTTDADGIDNLAGWLTTVVSRICLNMLRSRQRRPITSFDDHGPGVEAPAATPTTPEEQVCWPTRSGRPCSSSSTCCRRPSGSPWCSTT